MEPPSTAAPLSYREGARQEGYELIPLTGENREAAFKIFAASRWEDFAGLGWDEVMLTTFLRQQFDFQERSYQANYPEASLDLVLREGILLGRLYVNRQPDAIRVIEITLLPIFRNQGHGSALLREILADGAANQRRVTLMADCHNPAQRLYARLGFQPVAEDGTSRHWEWQPDSRP